jgi:hypothetical protein
VRLVGRRAIALACLVHAGCGPSVATLQRRNQVEQAFCRATDARDAAQVIPAMLARVAPEWRVREVLREDLTGVDAALAQQLLERYALLVVETRLHARPELKVGALTGVRSIPEDRFALAGMLLGPADFTFFTGEEIPASRVVTRSHLAHPETVRPWAILTLGLALVFADRVSDTETEYPSDTEVRSAAPRSAAIFNALRKRFGDAEIAVIARGPGTHAFRVNTKVLVDNHTGGLGEDCSVEMTATLDGAPFDVGESVAFPAGESFHAFAIHPWREATFSGSGPYLFDVAP